MKFILYFLIAVGVWITELILGKQLANVKSFEREYISFSFMKPDRESRTLNVLLNVMYPNFLVLIIYYSRVHHFQDCNVKYIWLIVLFYYVIRMAWIYLEGRSSLINKSAEIAMAVMGTSISVVLYYWYYTKGFDLSLSSEELINTVWITMIIFLYEVAKKILDEVTWHSEDYYRERYIEKWFENFRKKYDAIISSVLDSYYETLATLVYAVMIYENYNRPSFFRGIEWIRFGLNWGSERKMTLGVMQVESKRFIGNKKSVELGTKKLLNSYLKFKDSIQDDKSALFFQILKEYNLGDQYGGEVLSILEMIDESALYDYEILEDEIGEYEGRDYDDEIAEYIDIEIDSKDITALIHQLILGGDYVLEQIREDYAIVEDYRDGSRIEILIIADDEEALQYLLKERAQKSARVEYKNDTIVYYFGVKKLPKSIYGTEIVTPNSLSLVIKQKYDNASEEVKRIIPMERKWSIIER